MRQIPLGEVERHDAAEDFWTVIENKVYDLSGFDHPGGILINALAGTDGTVMFNQYHFTRCGLSDHVLKSRQIGVLSPTSPASPVIGAFYRDVSRRVGAVLVAKRLERRPPSGLFMVFFDLAAAVAFTGVALASLGPQSSLAALVAVPYLCDLAMVRLRSQSHAAGHLQLTGTQGAWAMELLLTVFSDTAFAYALPSSAGRNMRKALNRHRSTSQFEYADRGPYEHQVCGSVLRPPTTSSQCCYIFSLCSALFPGHSPCERNRLS
jgi:hypothetical protein